MKKNESSILSGKALLRELNQFHGTMDWYAHWLSSSLVYTDGIHYLANQYHAYWLIDLIVFELLPFAKQKKSDSFYVIHINVNNHSGTISVSNGNSTALVKKELSYIDLPDLMELKLYLQSMDNHNRQFCLMVPSEY